MWFSKCIEYFILFEYIVNFNFVLFLKKMAAKTSNLKWWAKILLYTISCVLIYLFNLFITLFFGHTLWHVEVPGLGFQPTPQPWFLTHCSTKECQNAAFRNYHLADTMQTYLRDKANIPIKQVTCNFCFLVHIKVMLQYTVVYKVCNNIVFKTL